MKTFILSLGFFVLAVVLSGFVYETLDVSTTETYSLESARVDHVAPADGRLEWAADEEEL